MKKVTFIIGLFFFFTMTYSEIFGEEITIDSTFSTSCEIFPFGEVELITSLGLTADIELNHDTSLVRIIFVPYDDYEYMIFEAYSLIVDSLTFSVREVCDETCFLNELRPYSVKLQIIDAEVKLTSLNYFYEEMENLPQLQFAAKREMDEQKIEMMTSRILEYNMNWEAADNDIVAEYYYQKKEMLGEGYHLLGFEYYHDGVFEFAGHAPYPKVNPDLVRSFDWRDRHGANDSTSAYWDRDILGTGWLTDVKSQGDCGSCWAFAATGATEAIANLFSANHLDFNLSEQQVISCADPDTINCNGGYIDTALNFIRDEGVITEYSCIYIEADPFCDSLDICSNPDTIIKIKNFYPYESNQDSIRICLIENGPQPIEFDYPAQGKHAVVLSGFEFDPRDSALTWIFKNSWGTGVGQSGFERMKISQIKEFEIVNPIFKNDSIIQNTCRDADGDSCYFWGIGQRPDTLSSQIVEDCDDSNPFVGKYDENKNCECLLDYDSSYHHITTDTSWNDTTYVNYTLMIDSGACLTITGFAAFSPDCKIIVRQGGELIIDGGYLTKVCPELWKGIEAWGCDTAQYFDQYFGKVVISNNGIIEFAKIGISNHCTLCDHYTMQSGGIILAEDATFRNNERDILLAPFKNMWAGNELPYYGIFKNCLFLTNDSFYPEFIPVAHVEMKDVMGVSFYGCSFKNESDYAIDPNNTSGIGISEIDAHFQLNKYCKSQISPCPDWQHCEFDHLEYGIKALNCQSMKTLDIREVNFNLNKIGISLSGIDYATILSNNFICNKIIQSESENLFFGGLFLEGCNGYHIEADTFYSPLVSADTGETYGIGVKNSGIRMNEIYNNYFSGLTAGIYCIGENRDDSTGLCLKCNDMFINLNDFIVVEDDNPPLGADQGIYYYQGNPKDSTSHDAPAGNTFSFFPSPADHENLINYNYFNAGENLWYVHHFSEEYWVKPLDSNYTRETIELKGWQTLTYQKDSACPSGIYGGGLKIYYDPRLTIYEADNNISDLISQLNELIDGGNTEELNFEVLTSMPDEALEIRQALLSDSPYLSDTVMKQAIYKEDVLPNAMIRDILQANPQSAKSDDILSTLEERFDPMPDYMMAQIMEGEGYLGSKELLEAEIQHWKQIRSKAKADLFREFLLDTNVISPIDSVIAFLDAENDLQSKYDLAYAYWYNYDTTNAFITLNNIPLQYNLNSHQAVIQDQYESYFGIMKMMEDSNWTASCLDSASIENLYNIMEEGSPKIAAHARGLLVKGGFYNNVETIVLPDLSKSSGPIDRPSHQIEDKPQRDNLLLFPNPASDFVIIYFTFISIESDSYVTLHDLKGNLIKTIDVDGTENQVVIDLQGISCGLYLISLYSGNELIDSKKLSKVQH